MQDYNTGIAVMTEWTG